jgi:DNA invertase Pin-like site-specific DNA recombinase
MNSSNQNKYFLYARKSTEDDDKQVMSIEAQLFELKEYVRRENISVKEIFTESKSAKTPGREQFARMIDKIEKGEANGVLAWHPDRLARNSVDSGKIIYLIDTGKIVSLRFPQFWFEPTPQGKFMLQVAFGQSKYYSDNLVENVKRGIRQKLRRGEWLTKAPYGYVNNLKTRNIEPCPVYSKIVVRAFEEYAKGIYTIEKLLKFLADLGLVTKKGKPLAKACIVRMLTNKAYLGFIKHHDEWYNGSFEPILSTTLFEAVQKVLKARQKPRKSKVAHPFKFLGFAKCGKCGSMITAQYTTNRFGTRYVYYRCTRKKGFCSEPYLQESTLAEQIKTQLQKVSIPFSEIEKMEKKIDEWEKESISEKGNVVRNLKSELLEVKEKLDKLVSIYLDEDIERSQYLERKNILLIQKAKIEESLEDFGQQRKYWLQPLRSFVLSLKEVSLLEKSDNQIEWKEFFQKIGSNPEIKDKTIHMHSGEIWNFVASAKGGSEQHSADFCSKNPLHISNFANVSLGAFILPNQNLFPKS